MFLLTKYSIQSLHSRFHAILHEQNKHSAES